LRRGCVRTHDYTKAINYYEAARAGNVSGKRGRERGEREEREREKRERERKVGENDEIRDMEISLTPCCRPDKSALSISR